MKGYPPARLWKYWQYRINDERKVEYLFWRTVWKWIRRDKNILFTRP